MKKYFFPLVVCVFLVSMMMSGIGGVAAESKTNIPSDAFRVLDISERTYEGGPAIAVLLSEPLNPQVRHDDHLRISDPKEMLRSAWVLSEDHRVLYFPHVEPETEYSVTVTDTLQSAEGQKLSQRISRTVKTRTITPIVSFASEGLLLPEKMTDGLPIVTVNVPSVEVEFFRLKDHGLVHFISWDNTTGKKDYYILSEARQYGDFVYSGRFDLDAPKNKRVVRHIPVETIDELQLPGVYLAIMREPGEYNYSYESTYFLVTDIGLHARIYRDRSILIASSLKNGQPLKDVKLTFYDRNAKIIDTAVTDNEGRYNYGHSLTAKEIYMIKAVMGKQIGLLSMNVPALDMSDFELGNRSYRIRDVYIYSPRDLYRPGEQVIFSALLRNDDGDLTKTLPLKSKLYRPDGREVRAFTWQAQNLDDPDINYYQTQIALPADAQTGKWTFSVYDDPASNKPAGSYEFHVEEFLPERMKLELKSDESASSESNVNIDVTGEYLYGAPASGNTVSTKVRVKAARTPFDKLKDFQFGNVSDESYKDYWEEPEVTLDDQGKIRLTIENRWKDIKSPLSVRVMVSLFESGGRPVTRSIDQTVFPGKASIGIRPLFKGDYADEGVIRFEVVKVNKDASLLPATGIMAEVTKEDRDYFWEYSESTGWKYRYSEQNYQFLTDTIRLDADKPTPYTLNLQNGQYVLTLTDPETQLTTSIRFYVGHYWWYGETSESARPDKVMLKPDQKAYHPGDVIQLSVVPPHDGEAVIMVEGEELLWFKRTPVSAKGTIVDIPVAASWKSHNLYISTVVFRPADAKEKITPNRAIGLIHLPLDRTSRKLEIGIDVPEKALPLKPLTASLSLDSPTDQTVFVTLAAVDVGILNITDFKTPDPFGWFFEPRRFEVNSYDIYGKVIESLEGQPARIRFGGDADMLPGGKRPETKVKLVSLFQAPVRFDNGKADVTFNLPDFNGRLRLMAIAFSPNAYGAAEKDVTVAAPIVTQLATPRFLAPGDQTQFTLDVHNLSGNDQELKLKMTVTELLLLEQGEQTLSLKNGEKVTLRFPVTVAQNFGAAIIRLHLDGEGITLDRDWQIGIRPGYPGTVRKVRHILNTEKTFTLDPEIAAEMIDATVSADLKISSMLPLNLRDAMQGLITYPYGCLEQTTSQAYPLLYATPERIDKYHLPPISHEERIKRLTDAIDRIYSMQLASGGFGLWSRSSPEVSWLSVYVTDFLIQARNLGIELPSQMLDNSLNRLEAYLNKGLTLDDLADERDHLSFSIRAYAGYVLAKIGRANLGTLRSLYTNHHKHAGSSLPLAYIGMALKLMGDRNKGELALALATQKRCAQYGYWGDYGSLVRDLALTVSLFIEHKADGMKGFEKLLLDLEDALRNRNWLSTQEKYAIFKAGLDMEGISGRIWKGRLKIGENETAIERNRPFVANLSAEDIRKGVTFISETNRILYVAAVINGYTVEAPAKDDAQISILRQLYDTEGKLIERSEFKVGEMLLVHLRISSNEWIPDGLVADLVPSGFEIENQNLKHSLKLEDFQIEGSTVWKWKEQTRLVHEEFRDDRYIAVLNLRKNYANHLFYMVRVVSPGTFSVPPPFVESMYRPEIRGIGDTPEPVQILNKR